MKIPKVIHYCWFGKGELPELAKKCINSWKKYCQEYEIIEWNESNFDINSNLYVKQAYEAKKYAFVSDYVRLYVLYNYGGIYMDTDVEVLKPLESFLVHEAFSGFETEEAVPTGIMGCTRRNEFFKLLMSYYDNRTFIKADGTYDITTNVEIITNYCKSNGLKLNNNLQDINGFILYPKEYFCPKNHVSGEINLTDNSYTIHHFAGSWMPRKNKIKHFIIKKIGISNVKRIVQIKNKLKIVLEGEHNEESSNNDMV